MAFLVPVFCLNGSVSLFTPILNDLVYSLRDLLFPSIFVLSAAPGTTTFFLGIRVGFHPSLISTNGGMILSSNSCTICLTFFRGVGIGFILGLGTGLSGSKFCFNNSFINCDLLSFLRSAFSCYIIL